MHILVLSLSFKGQLEKQAAVTLDVLQRAGADLQPLAVNASYVVALVLSLASGSLTGHREGTEHITLTVLVLAGIFDFDLVCILRWKCLIVLGTFQSFESFIVLVDEK